MQNNLTVRRVFVAVCAISLFGFTQAFAVAAKNPNKAANKALNAQIKAAPKYRGKVVSTDIAKGTITIQEKKLPSMTFTVSSTTKIKLDKADSTLSAILPGMHAVVRSIDKVSALEIVAHDKNAPAATPAPTPKSGA